MQKYVILISDWDLKNETEQFSPILPNISFLGQVFKKMLFVESPQRCECERTKQTHSTLSHRTTQKQWQGNPDMQLLIPEELVERNPLDNQWSLSGKGVRKYILYFVILSRTVRDQ